MKTLLVIDGNSIVNRAFFGVKDLSTARGMPTNAVFGFINIITRQMELYNPDKAVVAFDVHAPTFRHKMFDGYKAGRKPMPEELCVQMPYTARAAEALGCAVVEREGYEADDILGTYAAIGDREGWKTYLLTGDRDSLQLVSDSTAVLLAEKGEYPVYDRAHFFEKYGIQPEQFAELKAIMGDSSDSYSGVPGIGEVGAKKLMQQFGSLDAIYEHYKEKEYGLTAGNIKKLEEGRDSAYMSKTLATIFREVPVPALEELPERKLCRECARKLFVELEFGGFIKKFGLDMEETAAYDESDKVSTSDSLDGFLKPGTAVSYLDGYIFACDGKDTLCVPENADNHRLISLAAGGLLVRDAKAFCREAERFGVHTRGFGYDVMLAAYVCDSQGRTGLDDLVTSVLGDVRSQQLPDAYYVYKLKPELDRLLEERRGTALFRDIEMPLSDVLCDMESKGFLIDLEGLAEYGRVLNENISALSQRIYFGVGHEFNINSPKQLGEVLFDELGLPYDGKKKGNYSTSADILEKLAPYSQVVADVLEYRKLSKLVGTYINGLGEQADAEGLVHTSFRQTGTATGRLSSAEPNLQNIPVRTEEGRIIRHLFKARPGHVLVDADYSQIELRLMAAVSGDENMLASYRAGKDIHTSTAAAVFRVPEESVTAELRKRAKAVNFGIIYGIQAFTLANDLGITPKMAREYIEGYFESFPAVKAYLDGVIADAKEKGYVETLMGRRRYIPELSASNGMLRKFGERVAMNSPLQGTAADIIKKAMIDVAARLKEEKLDAELILQVHDELIIDASEKDAPRAAEILQECMEGAAELPVKLTVEITTAPRWEKA